jgi:RNA polymerase sigma-70 factor (sigma-E family)
VSFEDFARTQGTGLLRLAFALSGDRGRAEDVAQEALARVYLRWRRLDDPLPYARRIVVNATRDHWRRLGRREVVGLPEYDVVAADLGGPVVVRAALMAALRGLPHGQRAVLVLRYWQDLTEADTAAALGVSVGTVKSQAHRAVAALRTALTDEEIVR